MSARNTLAAKKERRVARNLKKVLAAEAPREERDPLLLNRSGLRTAIRKTRRMERPTRVVHRGRTTNHKEEA